MPPLEFTESIQTRSSSLKPPLWPREIAGSGSLLDWGSDSIVQQQAHGPRGLA